MTDIRIERLERDRLEDARKLVWRVFPHQSLPERLSFWAIANSNSPLVRQLITWAGVDDFLDLWGAVDQHTGRLVGTTGLYTYTRDKAEAAWLAWFCVDSEIRRRGIGSRLLDFTIQEARNTGRQYLRLYTSDRPNEAAAQFLYESRGLEIVAKKKRLFETTIYRELRLDQSFDQETGQNSGE